jgi:hypothetical protein
MDHQHHLYHQEARHESMLVVVLMMVVVAIKQNESIGDGISYLIAKNKNKNNVS